MDSNFPLKNQFHVHILTKSANVSNYTFLVSKMENSVSNYMFPASNDISYLKQQTCILHFKYISGVISIKITYFIFK